MFINGKIQSSIVRCKSLYELADVLEENIQYWSLYINDIERIIGALVDNDDYIVNDKFCGMIIRNMNKCIYNSDERIKIMMRVLSYYINRLVLKYSNLNLFESMSDILLFKYSTPSNCKVILNALITPSTRKILSRVDIGRMYPNISKSFYQAVMDLYVPTEDPEVIINTMLKYSSNEVYDIITSSIDYKGTEELLYKVNGDLLDGKFYTITSEFYVFIKNLKDIYLHEEIAHEMVIKYLRTLSHDSYINDIRGICDSYQRYFTEDVFYSAVKLLSDINSCNYSSVAVINFIRELNEIKSDVESDIKISSIIKNFIRSLLVTANVDKFTHAKILEDFEEIIKNEINPEDEELLANESFLEFPEGLYNPFEEPVEESAEAMEAYKKDSKNMHDMQNKIYAAYKSYSNAEDKVDSQISKAVTGAKKLLVGDTRKVIIEGKEFSALGLLKRLLAGVAVFSYSKIAFIIGIVAKYALKKSTTRAERQKILLELQEELEIINEKIDDAKGDGNRKAKYALMRTRNDLQNAITRIKYGLEVDKKALSNARKAIEK